MYYYTAQLESFQETFVAKVILTKKNQRSEGNFNKILACNIHEYQYPLIHNYTKLVYLQSFLPFLSNRSTCSFISKNYSYLTT